MDRAREQKPEGHEVPVGQVTTSTTAEPVPPPTRADLQDAARVVVLPMRLRFRGVVARQVLLLRGPAGWGEFAPFPEYRDAEAARWLAAAIESAWQPVARRPPAVRTAVPVNATVPAVPAADVSAVLARFPGCTTAKVKVAEPGQSAADDEARVAAVRDVLGEGGRIRVDANGAWTPEQAAAVLPRLSRHRLEYAEQPCPTVEGLARLRGLLREARVDVPIAADESVRCAEDPLRVALAGAADVVVLKVAPLGGVAAALAVAEKVRAEAGVRCVVSSALDSSVGLAAGVRLAAALPDLPFACGLGTAALLARDVTGTPLLPEAGHLPVRDVTCDPHALADLAAPPERERWWRERLDRCHAVLAAGAAA